MSRFTPVVMIVDDDQDSRELYDLALSLHGFTVVAVENGEQALRSIGQRQPDVIVTDLKMAGPVDGYELIRRQRGRPVIALTAWADPAHITRAVAAGCTRVLLKPCAPDDLAAAIKAVMAAAS